MNIKLGPVLLGALFFIIIHGCQPPTNLPTVPLQANSQTSALQDNDIPDISEAKKLLRPGTRDRIEIIYDENKQPINWIVLFNPPKPYSKEEGLKIQNEFFSDYLPSDYFPVCSLGSFPQRPNISYDQYWNWYSNQLSYGGWRNHPDPWVHKEGCRPVYRIRVGGSRPTERSEQRHIRDYPKQWGSYANNLTPYHPMWGIHNSIAYIPVAAMCDSLPTNGSVTVSLIKESACDDSSPAYQASFAYGDVPNGSGATPTPSESPTVENNYCPRTLQRNHLDIQEANLYSIKNRLLHLETFVLGESDPNFTTQMYRPIPKPYLPPTSPKASIQKFTTQSYDPSGSPGEYPSPNASYNPRNIYGEWITQTELHQQRTRLQRLLDELSSRLDNLRQNLVMSIDLEQQDSDSLKHELEQIQNSLTPIQTTFNDIAELETQVCKPNENTDNTPTIDIVYAGLEANGNLVLKGRAFKAPPEFDIAQIQADFNGDIEITDPNITATWDSEEANRFTITIPFGSYAYTEAYEQKMMEKGMGWSLYNTRTLPELSIRFTTGNGGFQTTNTLRFLLQNYEELQQAANHLMVMGQNLFEPQKITIENCTSTVQDIRALIDETSDQHGNKVLRTPEQMEQDYIYQLIFVNTSLKNRDKGCNVLRVTSVQTGKHIAYIANTTAQWKAYNAALLMLDRPIYETSYNSPSRSVAGRDIRVLLERVYSHTTYSPQDLPGNLFVLAPDGGPGADNYRNAVQRSIITNPARLVKTAAFTAATPDLDNGGVYTRFPRICDDYKSRWNPADKERTIKVAAMLEAVTRAHLLDLLQPRPLNGGLNWTQKWISQAHHNNKSIWEADNLIYAASKQNGKLGIHLFGIVENKTSDFSDLEDNDKKEGQFTKRIRNMNEHLRYDRPFSIPEISSSPVHIWDIQDQEQPPIILGISASRNQNNALVRRGKDVIRRFLPKGYLLGTVPESENQLWELVQKVEAGACQ